MMSTEAQKAAAAKWYAEHKEFVSAHKKAWYIANKVQVAKVKKIWYTANKDTSNAHSKAWIKANPIKAEKCRYAWRAKNPDYTRQYNKRRKEIKAGRKRPLVCEVCGRTGVICFDHCHATGKFRGWLCSNCNCILGLAKDKVEILAALTKYLKCQLKVDKVVKRNIKPSKVSKEKAA
jgi:hypothetical protein